MRLRRSLGSEWEISVLGHMTKGVTKFLGHHPREAAESFDSRAASERRPCLVKREQSLYIKLDLKDT